MSAALVAKLQRQAQQAEVERLALVKERDELRTELKLASVILAGEARDLREQVERGAVGESVAQLATEYFATVERWNEILGGGRS